MDINHEYYKKIDVKIESSDDKDKLMFHTRRKWDCDHYFWLGGE